MLIEVTKEGSGSILINTNRIETVQPTRTSLNWNCSQITLIDGTYIICQESYECIKNMIKGKNK